MVRHARTTQQAGFTVVEVVVTIVIATLFLIAITQLHITQARITQEITSRDKADLVAYNNLRTYAYGKSPSWFECEYSGATPLPKTMVNLNDPVPGLPNPVIQTVVATAPYGCGGSSTSIGYPIKVVSTVTYGADARKVVHATYSSY